MKSSAPRKSADQETIEAMAAAWLAQRDEGLTPSETQDFARWRAADPRHEAAVARLERTWRSLQHLRDFRPEARTHPDSDLLVGPAGRRLRHFPALPAAAALAAALVLAAVWSWHRVPPPATAPAATLSQTYATTAGGFQRLTLSDGSILELNASSEAVVAFSPAERRVRLLRGEVFFTVAKDPARPFRVSAGGVSVHAVGTAFNVRMDASQIEVLVTEGRVQVDEVGAGEAVAPHLPLEPGGPLLGAGNRLTVRVAAGHTVPLVEKLAAGTIREELAWQGPLLVFVDTPLAEVIAQFNRRNRVQLALGDPALATLPIGGSFRAESVEAFVRLLATDNEVVVGRPAADLIVLHRRSP